MSSTETRLTVSFVIPVYRNRDSLAATRIAVEQLVATRLPGLVYEIVFIDDGSDDGSVQELERLQELDPHTRVIAFSRNFGQVPAIVAGLRECRGDVAIVMSADQQDPPELVADMVDAWRGGSEVVIAHRESRQDSVAARLASRIFYGLIHLVNPKMPVGGFDFLLLSRRAMEELNRIDERNRFLQGDILWLGFRTTFLPYERRRRLKGRSQWTLSKKVKYFLDGLLGTSYWPIRAMSMLGLGTAGLGFAYAFVIVWARLVGKTPFQGWAPLMMVALILGGLNMIMLGIIGEYVWRIYDEARGRALYVIQRRMPAPDSTTAPPDTPAPR